LYGQSSCGKTTTVEAAASVWGKGASPGFVHSWRSTANALEAAAAIHTDTLFVLDELGVVEAKEAATAVYQLTSGTGKKRLKRDSTLRPSLTWRTMVLSTGELRMTDKLIEGNQRARAGQQVRLIDIPADAGMGFGVFSHAGPDGDAKALADALKTTARTSYGTAGPEFVRRLVANGVDKSAAAIEAMIKAFQKYTPPTADGQVQRVCDHFGLVAAAGELARELGIVGWQPEAAIKAARQCFADWLENRGGAEAGEVQAAISQVRLFIEQHGDSRFEPITGSNRVVSNRAGWRRGDSLEQEWLIPPETWKAEVAVGQNAQLVARTLADNGMLTCGSDGGLTCVVKIQGKSMRVYAVKASILAGTDNE